MEHTESEWLEMYRAGDVNALGQLVEQTRRPLFSFILRMVKNQHEAEEVFQEVWFRAVKNMDTYQDRKLMSWLFRIAHNLVIDRARKKKPDLNLEESSEGMPDWHERLASGGFLPDLLTMDQDLGIRIRDAVASLPETQKAVFLMRTEGDLSFKEIAEIQDTSINTSLARMQYALSKLRDLLSEDYQQLAKD